MTALHSYISAAEQQPAGYWLVISQRDILSALHTVSMHAH